MIPYFVEIFLGGMYEYRHSKSITKHYKTLQNININSTSSSATARHFFEECLLYPKIALPNIFKIIPWEHLKLSYNSYRKGFFCRYLCGPEIRWKLASKVTVVAEPPYGLQSFPRCYLKLIGKAFLFYFKTHFQKKSGCIAR